MENLNYSDNTKCFNKACWKEYLLVTANKECKLV